MTATTSVEVGRDVRAGFAWLPPIAVALVPAAAAAANGGYFASSWGWVALASAWLAAVTLGRRMLPGRAMLAALVLFGLWVGVSEVWSPSPTFARLEGEQLLALILAVVAFVTVVQRRTLGSSLLALLCGLALVCAYALLTRLFPDQLSGSDAIAGYRLTRPIGYWNALGIYAALGLAVGLGIAVRTERTSRAIAGATLPIFALVAYFTYSRGAAIALAIGLLVTFVFDSDRVGWLFGAVTVAIPAAVGVIVSSRSGPLTTAGHSIRAATQDGHRLALLTLGLSGLTACIGAWAPNRRWRLTAGQQAVVTAVVAVAILVVLAGGLVAVGGPSGIKDKFTAAPLTTHGQLNKRFFSFSGSYRAPIWRVAWQEYTAHPVLGGGAGSYEAYYLQHRTRPDKVKNAHNLYLETLAELGPVGLGLLLIALLTPFYAGVKGRRHPLVPALTGAYVAFLVHMAVDWDWQVTAVALTGLFCGAGILVAARSDAAEQREMSSRLRYALLAATLVVMVVAFVGLVGNMSLAQASNAAGKGNWATSAKDAKRAHTWAPWSSEPYRLLGEAQLGQGDTKAAIASFNKAIAKSPSDWNLWFDLARATTGNAQRDALRHAKQLNPLSPEIAELQKELDAEKVITVVPKSPVQP